MPLIRNLKQQGSSSDGIVNRIGTTPHRDPNHEIGSLKEVLGQPSLFVSDDERRRPTTAQGFIVQQPGW
jgi:hypothetical protein